MRKSLYRRHNQVFLGLLRRYREQGKFRQRDLAQHLGSVQGTVSKAETGNRRLDVIELREWLLAMGVDFLEFMTELHNQLEAADSIDPSMIASRPQGHQTETAIEAHVAGLAEMLIPTVQSALFQEASRMVAELQSLQIRGRSFSTRFDRTSTNIAQALQPSDTEVLSDARDLARLLLSNWSDLLRCSPRERAAELVDAIRSDRPSLPVEATAGCLDYPGQEEDVRRILMAYLRHHLVPDLLNPWQLDPSTDE